MAIFPLSDTLREKSGYEGFKMHDFGETELNSRNTAKPVKQEISWTLSIKLPSRSVEVETDGCKTCPKYLCLLFGFYFFVGDNGVCRSNFYEWLFCSYF